MLLQGKRVILTGSASGIGATTLQTFTREGAAVVSLDVQDEMGAAGAAEAGKLGPGPITYMHCDVSKQDEVNKVFEKAISQLGGLDALVAMASVERMQQPEHVTEQEIDFIFNVHFKGTAFTNAAAFPALRDNGGSIINYTSGAGIIAFPGTPLYGAAKAAILGWTRTAALEWGKYKIRVNAVSPLAETPQSRAMVNEMGHEALENMKAWFKMSIPLGGWMGETEDVANANVFLVSDLSRFITGQTICVDGGWVMVR